MNPLHASGWPHAARGTDAVIARSARTVRHAVAVLILDIVSSSCVAPWSGGGEQPRRGDRVDGAWEGAAGIRNASPSQECIVAEIEGHHRHPQGTSTTGQVLLPFLLGLAWMLLICGSLNPPPVANGPGCTVTSYQTSKIQFGYVGLGV